MLVVFGGSGVDVDVEALILSTIVCVQLLQTPSPVANSACGQHNNVNYGFGKPPTR